MRKKTTRASNARRVKRIQPDFNVGQDIRFLFPSWVAPLYIMKGTVASIKHQSVSGKDEILYTVNYKRQYSNRIIGGVVSSDPIDKELIDSGQTVITIENVRKVALIESRKQK